MQVIVLAAQKGGSSKSTLALNLAVEAERSGDGPVTLIDTDPQGSLSKWWNRRGPDTPSLAEVDVDRIEDQLGELAKRGSKLAIIDTPGALTSRVKSTIRAATLVLIPSRPSIFDLETLVEFADVVEGEGRPMAFVPSMVKGRTRIATEAIRNLSQFGPVGPSISDRVDFALSLNDGRAVCELRAEGEAAQEIVELWTYVKRQLRKSARAGRREDVKA